MREVSGVGLWFYYPDAVFTCVDMQMLNPIQDTVCVCKHIWLVASLICIICGASVGHNLKCKYLLMSSSNPKDLTKEEMNEYQMFAMLAKTTFNIWMSKNIKFFPFERL